MNPLWWIGIAGVLAIAEIVSLDLVLIMFAGGALAAAGAGALGAPLWAQIVVFVIASVMLLGLLRPWLLRNWRERVPLEETNTAAHIGRAALVVSPVDAVTGRIKLVGEVWTARTAGAGTKIPSGSQVRVIAIDGATAVVEPLD